MRKRMTVILDSKMNIGRFYVSATLLLTALLAVAENNPYWSDVFWVTVPDHADRLYRTGEQANAEVRFYKYGIPGGSIAINFEVGGEIMPADTEGAVIMRRGKATILVGTMRKPGFRDCRLATTIGGKRYSHHAKVDFLPEELRPYTAMPVDFQQLWEGEETKLTKSPLTYTEEHVKKYSVGQIDRYLIKLQMNRRGQSVYGYLSHPKKEGKYPVVLYPPGIGIKTIKEPLRHKYYAKQDCIRFEAETHGLNLEISEEEFKETSAAFSGREDGYLPSGLDNRNNYYTKRAYLAYVRSIGLLTSLPEQDRKNVIVQGGNQEGALALITAGLDRRAVACVASHPALSGIAGYKADCAGGYLHFFRDTVDMDTPGRIKTVAYYDVVNLAQLIKADTYMTWGFNDGVCPSTTSYIVYNILNCPKEALIAPINEHWTSSDTEYGHPLWTKKHLK